MIDTVNDSLPRVAIFTLGGTIASIGDPGSPVAPGLAGEELVATVPALGDVARVEVHEVRRVPSGDLSVDDLIGVVRVADRCVADGVVGVVVVQGTDTLEESAFVLDLLGGDVPMVLTGAMRHPASAGADGPANLVAATVTAAAPEAVGLGALVVMNDEVHAARWVRKSHTTNPGAFHSPTVGPVGEVIEGRLHPRVRPEPLARLAMPSGPVPAVALYSVSLGDDGRLLDDVVAKGFAGLVVAAYGAGHVSARLADRLEGLARDIPVVLASRTGAGSVLSSTYGFAGSESDLLARGVISAGSLDSRKSRVALSLALGSRATREEVVALFAQLARVV